MSRGLPALPRLDESTDTRATETAEPRPTGSNSLGIVLPDRALRFLICYFVLYTPAMLSSLSFLAFPRDPYERFWAGPVRTLSSLVGLRALGVPPEEAFEIVHTILLALLAAAGTAIWLLRAPGDRDRARLHHHGLRIGLRYLLACGAVHYAILHLLRFELPGLTPEDLVTPVGDRHPAELLWAFLGWSWAFMTALAAVELGAAILLLRRETVLLGALLMMIVLSNVVALNFGFDVSGKSLSLHFALMAGLLILPDSRRLVEVHILGRPVPHADMGREFPRGQWLRRNRGVLKASLVALFVASPLILAVKERGSLFKPQAHVLSGLYDVETFRLDGRDVPPVLGDSLRWRWAIIPEDASRLHVQLANSEWIAYPMSVDAATPRLLLGRRAPSEWRLRRSLASDRFGPYDTLQIVRQDADGLHISGPLDERVLETGLQRVDIARRFRLHSTR